MYFTTLLYFIFPGEKFCKVPLCLGKCFESYHVKENYQIYVYQLFKNTIFVTSILLTHKSLDEVASISSLTLAKKCQPLARDHAKYRQPV